MDLGRPNRVELLKVLIDRVPGVADSSNYIGKDVKTYARKGHRLLQDDVGKGCLVPGGRNTENGQLLLTRKKRVWRKKDCLGLRGVSAVRSAVLGRPLHEEIRRARRRFPPKAVVINLLRTMRTRSSFELAATPQRRCLNISISKAACQGSLLDTAHNLRVMGRTSS